MKISVIIPTLNEETCLGETLAHLRGLNPHEIIVADGGSTDSTLTLAQDADHVVNGPRGRAAQMNGGAAHATGDALLFLHADCLLESGALRSIEKILPRRSRVAGCFRMKVQATGFLYRMIDLCATARVGLTGIIYGDQGLFLTRKVWDDVGGFPEVRFMEDVQISLKLRTLGRVVVSPQHIYVSPRRWQRSGIIRQTLRNWTLTGLAACGIHPDKLAQFYPLIR